MTLGCRNHDFPIFCSMQWRWGVPKPNMDCWESCALRCLKCSCRRSSVTASISRFRFETNCPTGCLKRGQKCWVRSYVSIMFWQWRSANLIETNKICEKCEGSSTPIILLKIPIQPSPKVMYTKQIETDKPCEEMPLQCLLMLYLPFVC